MIFTINLGVCSGGLVEFFSPDEVDRQPPIERCHWRKLVGNLLLEGQDKWWGISDHYSSDDLMVEMGCLLVDLVIPDVILHTSDKSLCEKWMSGDSPGLTEFQRLINLSVLLKRYGENEKLIKVVRQLEEEVERMPAVRVHLRHLESL